jgi:hypothetical protein
MFAQRGTPTLVKESMKWLTRRVLDPPMRANKGFEGRCGAGLGPRYVDRVVGFASVR